MTDIEPCISPRCRQAGRCSCVHIYEDGAFVPGSGQIDDPYVHERPMVQCVYDADGQQIVPDSNRCITLPNCVSKIVLSDGTTLLPNSSGQIDLGLISFSNFIFQDSNGTQLMIADGDTATFAIDGDQWTGYSQQEYDLPTIVGGEIVMPAQKVRERSAYLLEDRLSGGSLEISGGASTYFLIAGFPIERSKTTNYELNVSIGIMEDISTLNHTAGEELSLQLEIVNGTALVPDQTIGSVFYWTPNDSFGYTHINFTHDLLLQGPEDPSSFDIALNVVSNSLIPARRVFLEINALVSWV